MYQTVIGNSEDYYIVVEFDSLTHRDKVFETMAKDVEYQKLEQSWKGIITLTNIYSTMIKPIEPPAKK